MLETRPGEMYEILNTGVLQVPGQCSIVLGAAALIIRDPGPTKAY